ncbi:putative metalloprotease with PDZ domain [Chitinivorax tropicus]|uniref:Putative metalloprotease with PDZ domain n=1 Tax=Chitinivorax tropicus TaxID=714531 RepID=A0A840MQR0_9PROT|nr:M61 family metallopeptidase [Chitinivorax tropicus]MBB5019427.1 putative metalloprotease with PDZ domain [Chitinivorax tropicus]
MKTSPIRYRIECANPEAHLFHITQTIPEPSKSGQRLSLPAWIPGSYLIREFARHIVRIDASVNGKPVPLTKLDKHTWLVAPTKGVLTVTYEVYAFDLSVRGAYFDQTRAFFNGTSVFLCVEGQEHTPCEVEIVPPEGKAYKSWRVATALRPQGAKRYGFGTYEAADYDELIDHPVEISDFTLVSFKACGVPHDFVLSGRHDADMKRLAKDIKKICEYQIKLFGEPAPFDRYVFMTMLTGDGYGGLEHRASTALMAARADMPIAGDDGQSAGYRQFLGLVSHEYFHSWNVKRIKPQVFAPYNLAQEGYTRLLWAMEGVTSYYDDLVLLRAGVITEAQYLELVAKTVTGVMRGAGRLKQNLEESSFDAWVKYYRQDENSPNSLVSYYTKGSMMALALDLTIRDKSSGQKSLDDVMRALWQLYLTRGEGIGEAEWEHVACEITGLDLKPFFDHALRSTGDLPLPALLKKFGVQMTMRAAESGGDKGGSPSTKSDETLAKRPVLGARSSTEQGFAKLTHVLDDGAAQAAGLSAGDLIVAVEGLKVSGNLDALIERRQVGDKVTIHAFRRDELMSFTVKLRAPAPDTCVLQLDDKPGKAQLAARHAWLSGRTN